MASVIHEEEVERVMLILTGIKELENTEDPHVPYFSIIKPLYDEIKRKLKIKGLSLDISGVSYRPPTSPSSVVSFSKDFLFDKRFNFEPNEDNVIGKVDTNRSEMNGERSKKDLERYNEILQEKIEKMDEYICLVDQREE